MRRLFFLGLAALVCLGFRIYPGGNLWRISKSEPKLYLKFCEPMVPEQNDVSPGDALADLEITHNQLVDSILADYNQIYGAYVVLADADRDVSFDSTLHASRKIEICFSGQQDNIEGHARAGYDESGEYFKDCQVRIGRKTTQKARRLIRTLTHEIGHCLGLDHPQETNDSVMSYFSGSSTYRLQADDKSALVYLYPENSEDVAPRATLGLSCSPR